MDHIIISYYSETFKEILSTVVNVIYRSEYNTRKDYQELFIGSRDDCWTVYTNSIDISSKSIGYHTVDRTIAPQKAENPIRFVWY